MEQKERKLEQQSKEIRDEIAELEEKQFALENKKNELRRQLSETRRLREVLKEAGREFGSDSPDSARAGGFYKIWRSLQEMDLAITSMLDLANNRQNQGARMANVRIGKKLETLVGEKQSALENKKNEVSKQLSEEMERLKVLYLANDFPTKQDWMRIARIMTTPAGPPPEGILHEDWVRPEIQMLEACVLKCFASQGAYDAMRKRLETLVGIGAAIDSHKLVNDIWERCFSTLEYNATCNRERRQKMKKLLDDCKLLTKRQRTDGTPSDH